MANDTMNKEFPDVKQRAAVCFQKWKDKKSKSDCIVDDGNDETIYMGL